MVQELMVRRQNRRETEDCQTDNRLLSLRPPLFQIQYYWNTTLRSLVQPPATGLVAEE